jgi:hypothetical protein
MADHSFSFVGGVAMVSKTATGEVVHRQPWKFDDQGNQVPFADAADAQAWMVDTGYQFGDSVSTSTNTTTE